MQSHHVGAEGGVGLPEHDRHDVVVDMSLPLELLEVCLGKGEEGGHVVYYLLVTVIRVLLCSPLWPNWVSRPPPVALVHDHVHVHDTVKIREVTAVPKQHLLAGLALPLVDNTTL